ncbi:TcdA/TcdB catalytic glycosyltransferase domain-containing protein [Candidatus Cardinium hertigii]|nr:TcdA/TcdB catalytic glycosyltransferase domain-containing protein [Candidatus Cardinium hertigii]
MQHIPTSNSSSPDFVRGLLDNIQNLNSRYFTAAYARKVQDCLDNLKRDNITQEEKYQEINVLRTIIKIACWNNQMVNISTKTEIEELDKKLAKVQLEVYNTLSSPVPKELHFIWLGSPLGKIQKSYIETWYQVNNGDGYQINIWYDSQALIVYETNEKIKEYVKKNFPSNYITQVNDLQDQLFNAINNSCENPDVIRVRFLTQEKIVTEKENFQDKLEQNQQAIKEFQQQKHNLYKIRDIRTDGKIDAWTLKDPYNQELSLRMNCASASDCARLEIIKQYGGIYIDVDLLPPFQEHIDIFSDFKNLEDNKIELNRVLYTVQTEQLLNNVPAALRLDGRNDLSNHYLHMMYPPPTGIFLLYPSSCISSEMSRKQIEINRKHTQISIKKDIAYYWKLKEIIQSIQYTSNNISSKSIKEIFAPLGEIKIMKNHFRTSSIGYLCNNSFIATHCDTGSENNDITKLIKKISGNYARLKKIGDKKNITNLDINFLSYRKDGLEAGSSATVAISGPAAYNSFYRENFQESYKEKLPDNIVYQHIPILMLYPSSNYENNIQLPNALKYNTWTEEDATCSWMIDSDTQVLKKAKDSKIFNFVGINNFRPKHNKVLILEFGKKNKEGKIMRSFISEQTASLLYARTINSKSRWMCWDGENFIHITGEKISLDEESEIKIVHYPFNVEDKIEKVESEAIMNVSNVIQIYWTLSDVKNKALGSVSFVNTVLDGTLLIETYMTIQPSMFHWFRYDWAKKLAKNTDKATLTVTILPAPLY